MTDSINTSTIPFGASALGAPPLDDLDRLGPYRLLRILGEGGTSTVFLAVDTQLNRQVALKVIQPSPSGDAPERLLREARTLASLDHDHIVPVYQIGEDGGLLYLAMKLLKGETLQARLANDAMIPPHEVMRIGREIAEGLAVAHAAGLIHRDIKPANIWLESPNDRVKLLDFGLARPTRSLNELTVEGLIVGTPLYMSPEQARNLRLDARTDLFSLGVVLYRMIAGEHPFEGSDSLSVMVAVAHQAPKPIKSLPPGVPPAFAALVAELLSREPDRRPADATEVVTRIRRIEGGEAPPLPRRATRSRRRMSGIAAAVLVGAALGGFVAFSRSPAQEQQPVAGVESYVEQFAFAKHEGGITGLDVSPDGTRVLSAGKDKVMRLWNRDTGAEERTFHFPGHLGSFGLARFSPDGTHVLHTGHAENFSGAILFNLADGTERQRFLMNESWCDWAGFDRSGHRLFTIGRQYSAAVWDTASGEEKAKLTTPGEWITIGAISPDGRLVVSASAYEKVVRVWNAETGGEKFRLHGHPDTLTSIEIAPDGRTMASGSKDGSIRIWDLHEKQTRVVCLGHEGPPSRLAFFPDGAKLVSAGLDDSARVWDAATGKELGRLQHTNDVTAVCVTADGSTILTGSGDGMVRGWRVVR